MATDTHTIENAAAAEPTTPTVGQLSFTGRRADDSGVDLWSPAEIGSDWVKQCRRGRSYGYEAVKYIRETNDAAMLQGVVRAMAKHGIFGGVEAGFFAALSMSLAEAA